MVITTTGTLLKKMLNYVYNMHNTINAYLLFSHSHKLLMQKGRNSEFS